jgi:hypothetical protein
MDIDLSGAIGAITWQTVGTDTVLAVYPDEVWLWSLASPSEPWTDRAGTFHVQASESERAALLAALRRAPDVPPTGGLELLLTVDNRDVRCDAGSESGAEIGALVAPLLGPDRVTPLSAVWMRAAMLTPPGMSETLALSFESLGRLPVPLRLDGDRVTLLDADGPWVTLPPPRIGLVDDEGAPLDGLTTPATIPSGGLGAWLLNGAADQPDTAPAAGQRVRVYGWVTIAGPIDPIAMPFEVTALIS